MKIGYFSLLAAFGLFATSCATQSASTGSTDDIYYTSGSASTGTTVTETTTTTIPNSESYSTYPGASDNYEYSGSADDDAEYRTYGYEPESETYYDEDGNTYVVNNYYEDDYNGYDDYYYTSSIYRYYSPYNGFGYYSHCYSPYYYSPYSYHGGWNTGFSFGWGSVWYGSYPCYPYGYGYGYHNPWYGYNPYWYDPWYSPYYGYGYGYGSYWNGYHNGYWNGYYDGYYGGYGYPNDYYGGYYGYDDDNHYYGPNTSTGSNTNTGQASSVVIGEGYDKTGMTEQVHHVDKSDLGISKNDVDMIVSSPSEIETPASPESVTVKGDVKDIKGTSATAFEKPVVHDNPVNTATSGGGVVRENGTVKVIKYYKADDAVATPQNHNTGSVNTNVKNDVRNDYSIPSEKTYSKPGVETKSNDYSRPDMNVDQDRTNNNTYSVPKYTQPKQEYSQPKYDDRQYEQPSKSSNTTWEKPKFDSNSNSSSGRSTWNNNSGGSNNSGSWSTGGSSGGSRPSGGGSSGGGGVKKRGG